MGDELDASGLLSLASGNSSSSDDDGDADEDATAELVRSMETMLAESAPRRATPSGATPAVAAAADDTAIGCGGATTASHNDPVRDWREEWRCSTRAGLQTSGGGCERPCMPVAEAQRSRVVEIPGLLDPSEIEQIHALAGRCTDADPFWDA